MMLKNFIHLINQIRKIMNKLTFWVCLIYYFAWIVAGVISEENITIFNSTIAITSVIAIWGIILEEKIKDISD